MTNGSMAATAPTFPRCQKKSVFIRLPANGCWDRLFSFDWETGFHVSLFCDWITVRDNGRGGALQRRWRISWYLIVEMHSRFIPRGFEVETAGLSWISPYTWSFMMKPRSKSRYWCRTPVLYPSAIPVVTCQIGQRHIQSTCMLTDAVSWKKMLPIFEALPLGTIRLLMLQAKVPIRQYQHFS